MLNYACPAELLLPYLPLGVELDSWEGEFLMSVVGLMFLDTKVLGVSGTCTLQDFQRVI